MLKLAIEILKLKKKIKRFLQGIILSNRIVVINDEQSYAAGTSFVMENHWIRHSSCDK